MKLLHVTSKSSSWDSRMTESGADIGDEYSNSDVPECFPSIDPDDPHRGDYVELIIDENGTIRNWNAAAWAGLCALHGVTPEEPEALPVSVPAGSEELGAAFWRYFKVVRSLVDWRLIDHQDEWARGRDGEVLVFDTKEDAAAFLNERNFGGES